MLKASRSEPLRVGLQEARITKTHSDDDRRIKKTIPANDRIETEIAVVPSKFALLMRSRISGAPIPYEQTNNLVRVLADGFRGVNESDEPFPHSVEFLRGGSVGKRLFFGVLSAILRN